MENGRRRNKTGKSCLIKENIMPKLIINDREHESRPGERLLSVARRQGEHIGFVCLGRGYCHTCACRILEGAEHLSPPTEREKNWHKAAGLRDNYRLACQTFLQGDGPVSIISRAEELRRQASSIIAPPEGTTSIENLSEFLGTLGGIAVRFPSTIADVATHIGQNKLSPEIKNRLHDSPVGPELENIQETVSKTSKRVTPNMKLIRKVIDDTTRMAQNMMMGTPGNHSEGQTTEARKLMPQSNVKVNQRPSQTEQTTSSYTKTRQNTSLPQSIALQGDTISEQAETQRAEQLPKLSTPSSPMTSIAITLDDSQDDSQKNTTQEAYHQPSGAETQTIPIQSDTHATKGDKKPRKVSISSSRSNT
jgi:ferredoxin